MLPDFRCVLLRVVISAICMQTLPLTQVLISVDRISRNPGRVCTGSPFSILLPERLSRAAAERVVGTTGEVL